MEENIKCLIKAREKQEGSFWTRKVSKPAFKVHLANNYGSKYNTYTSESYQIVELHHRVMDSLKDLHQGVYGYKIN